MKKEGRHGGVKRRFGSPLLGRIVASFWRKEETAIGTRFVEGIGEDILESWVVEEE